MTKKNSKKMAEVNFKHGSFNDYRNLSNKDDNTLYFIEDRPSLFKGSSAIVGVYNATVLSETVQISGNSVTTNNVTIYAYSGANGEEATYTFSTVNPNITGAIISFVQSQLSKYVAKSGDTMNGNLTMSGASVVFVGDDGKEGGTTGSVNVHCAGSGSVTGGGITNTAFSAESAFSYSILALESTAGTDNKSVLIKNVSWPDSNLDAANKLYVDAQIAGVVGGAIQSINYIKSVKINGFTVSGTPSGAQADFTLSGGNYITISDSRTRNTIDITANQVRISAATAMSQGLADAYDVKQYISGVSASIIAQSDAMVYKGTVSARLSAGTYNKGWTYRVSSPFSGYGTNLEAGDMIIVNTDITASTEPTQEQVDIIQANIDGAVTTTGFLPVEGVTGSNGQVVIATGSHETISLANPSSSDEDKVLTCKKGVVQWSAPTEDTDTTYTIGHSGGAQNTVELSSSDGTTSAITINNVASAGVANSASVANHVDNSFKYTQDSSGSTGNTNVTYNGSATAEIKSTSALTSGHTESIYNYLVTEAAVVNYVNNSKPQWSSITGN